MINPSEKTANQIPAKLVDRTNSRDICKPVGNNSILK